MKVTVITKEREIVFEPENYRDLVVLVCRLLPEKPIGVWKSNVYVTRTLDTLVEFLREHSQRSSAVADMIQAAWITNEEWDLTRMTIEIPQIGEVSKYQKW